MKDKCHERLQTSSSYLLLLRQVSLTFLLYYCCCFDSSSNVACFAFSAVAPPLKPALSAVSYGFSLPCKQCYYTTSTTTVLKLANHNDSRQSKSDDPPTVSRRYRTRTESSTGAQRDREPATGRQQRQSAKSNGTAGRSDKISKTVFSALSKSTPVQQNHNTEKSGTTTLNATESDNASGNSPATGLRINKALAKHYSRRKIDKLVDEKRIMINGKLATHGDRVVQGDTIQIVQSNSSGDNDVADSGSSHSGSSSNDELLTVDWQQDLDDLKQSHVYYKYWKPIGVICTTDTRVRNNIVTTMHIASQKGQEPTIDEAIRIFPVGRLDKDTSGLILVTSDGNVPNAVLHRNSKQPKTYKVTVDKPLTIVALQQLRDGVVITTQAQDSRTLVTERTLPALNVEQLSERSLSITIIQGRNRQVRKMLQAVGYEVIKLHRTRFMDITLSGLQSPGQWMPLSTIEMRQVRNVMTNRDGQD